METLETAPIKYRTNLIYRYAVNVALTVFLFGYETTVFNPWQDAIAETLGWGDEKKRVMISIMSSLIPVGAVIGALLSTCFGNRYGRRQMILFFGFIRSVSCLVNVIPYTFAFAIGRLGAGVSIGISQIYIPLYLNEIAPNEIRGKVTLLFGITLTVGQLTALSAGVPLGFGVSRHYWVLLFLFPVVIQLVQAFAFFRYYVHDSAKWLVQRNCFEEAKAAIEFIYEPESVDEAYSRLFETERDQKLDSLLSDSHRRIQPSVRQLICDPRYRRSVLIGCFIQVFNIMNGINCIFFYSALMFQQEGQSPGVARVESVALATWNVLWTLVSIPFIDRIGRRPLLMVGCAGMAVTEAVLGYLVFTDQLIVAQIVLLMGFILAFDIGIGPVGWVVTSEILDLPGILLANLVSWWCLILLTAGFPFAIQSHALGIAGTFWVFAGISLCSFWFVKIYVAETKGMDKREIAKMLQELS